MPVKKAGDVSAEAAARREPAPQAPVGQGKRDADAAWRSGSVGPTVAVPHQPEGAGPVLHTPPRSQARAAETLICRHQEATLDASVRPRSRASS